MITGRSTTGSITTGLPVSSSSPIEEVREMFTCVHALVGLWAAALFTEPQPMRQSARIIVVCNNMPCAPGLISAWGFAAFIQTGNDAVLFYTGGDGPTLLANLRRLEINPTSIDAAVLSHMHADHTGGLDDFLTRHSNVMVFMPSSSPKSFRHRVERYGATERALGDIGRLKR
jgi:glyoxylase-like metal-dependent hydrolase (beta-lactamase superfamily II)